MNLCYYNLMSQPDLFFVTVLLTVLLIRVWIIFVKIGSPKLKYLKLHHYMYGFVILAISFIFSNIIIYGIGFAFVLDEIPVVLKHGNTFAWDEYDSKFSRVGVIVCLILTFIFRNYLFFV